MLGAYIAKGERRKQVDVNLSLPLSLFIQFLVFLHERSLILLIFLLRLCATHAYEVMLMKWYIFLSSVKSGYRSVCCIHRTSPSAWATAGCKELASTQVAIAK